MYRIRQVDTDDEDAQDLLRELHDQTFGDSAPQIANVDMDTGEWWVGVYNPPGFPKEPVSFAGLIPATLYPEWGYFSRVGVLPEHRGHGLQRRHMAAIERRARALGMVGLVTDTTDNPHSANNIRKAGWEIFTPDIPWGAKAAIYWRKSFVVHDHKSFVSQGPREGRPERGQGPGRPEQSRSGLRG